MTAMNDREIIEHWALREAFLLWFLITCACLISAIVCGITGFFFEPALYLPATCAVVATLLAHWRMRRIWKRIVRLEQFIH
jgi:membrane protein YdbS with pleckstrin-like domain